jgi:tRNA(Ile)-lysidine synthase TilS/MesJ
MSGGKDSCYSALVAKNKNLNPLLVTFDNGFMSEEALHNISNVVNMLGMDHVIEKVPWEQIKKYYRHNFLNTGEFCSVCNVGIRAALYRTADKYKIKLIVSGTSPRTEADSPPEYFSCSNGYFENIFKNAIATKEIKNFEFHTGYQRIISQILKKPAYLQLPRYLPWKEDVILQTLKNQLNWRGEVLSQHNDCKMSDAKEWLNIKKFGMPEQAKKLSALICDGQIDRKDALKNLDNYTKKILSNENVIRAHLRQEFSISDLEIDSALSSDHTKFIPKNDRYITFLKKHFYK